MLLPTLFRIFGFLLSPEEKTSPNNGTKMPPPQVTFSVNLVAFSVKMKVARAKKAASKAKSLSQQLRRQLSEPRPETSGKRAGILVAHFRGHLGDGIIGATFQQVPSFA